MTGLMKILSDLITGRSSENTRLPGGLMMQYRQAGPDNPVNRLLCYRAGTEPSVTEMMVVHQHIERLLPVGTAIQQDSKLVTYQGADGLERRGYVLHWQSISAPPRQASLLGDVESTGAGAYEGL